MKNTNKLLNQEIIPSSFYDKFKDLYTLISENETISSKKKNDNLVSYFFESISFIKNMLEYNHVVFNDTNINYKEKFPGSNLYKNLSSEDFSNFSNFIFQKLKYHILDPDFLIKFESDAYNFLDIKDNELNFSNIKNSYIFPLKERIINITKNYLIKRINNNDFFVNNDFLATELKKYNFLSIEDISNFSLYFDKFKTLEEIARKLEKEPENFSFFDKFNFQEIKYNYNNHFGTFKSSDISSLSLYILSKNIGSEQDKIKLTKQVIQHLEYFDQSAFNKLLNYVPLHRLNLINSNVYDDLTVTKQLTKIVPDDLNIFHFNDKFQKTPKNKILCEALDNIFMLDLNKFSIEDKILLLQCSLEQYFGLNDNSQQVIYSLSHSLSQYLNIKQINSFINIKKVTFNLPEFIVKDYLINDKNINPEKIIADLTADTYANIIETVNNFFNNPLVNSFLDNEKSTQFSKFYLYSYLQDSKPSFIIEHNYKQQIYDEVLAIKNKNGITFEEFLFSKKHHIFKIYDNAMDDYFSITSNSKDTIFNPAADNFIKKFKSNSIVTILPLLEYCFDNNTNNNNIEDICKIISYKPFHNFKLNNHLEFGLHVMWNLSKISYNCKNEDLDNISMFLEELFLHEIPKLKTSQNIKLSKMTLVEQLSYKPEFKNFRPILKMLKNIEVSEQNNSILYTLHQECAEKTLAKINHKILSIDNELMLSKPTIRARVRKF